MSPRLRILFIVEDITMAQVVRLVFLARALDPARYEVHFASAHFDELIFGDTDFVRHSIYTVPAAYAFRRLERGQRLYEHHVLEKYVEDELALFASIRPHAVIGDLRFSLSVSAPHAGIPYAALINAYWSRAMIRESFPLPEHPIVSLLGQEFAGRYFFKALPWVFKHFAAPVNKLRKRYGLAPLGDLIDLLMFGDRTLFPDIPRLTPLSVQAPSEVFLGPILWEPRVTPPAWWNDAQLDGPSAYVTLGSSGRLDRLPATLAGLGALGIPLLVATAGRIAESELASGLYTAPFLAGSEAAQRTSFTVCNGGSSTAYQALAQGKPVLGIASNLDQYLAMTAVRDAGAGILLRADSLTADAVTAAARQLLEQPKYRLAAEGIAVELRGYDCHERFASVLHSLGA
ncbi:MAG: putative glycosyl transferase [Myxococcaceae bacterium]|nr:putative glycosyl transferase [Myxococcaceae bacterium]